MRRSSQEKRRFPRRRAGGFAALAGALLAMNGAASAAPVATLLRVTLNAQPVNASTVTSYGVETMLVSELQSHAHQTIDLTPLHADFQKLRYSYDCPVVDGSFTHDDCAQFGNYAEAVIQVLENVQAGVGANVQSLAPLQRGGYVLVGEIRAKRTERDIVGDFHFRVHGFCDGSMPVAQSVNHSIRIGTTDSDAALSQFYGDIIYRGIEESAARIGAGGASC